MKILACILIAIALSGCTATIQGPHAEFNGRSMGMRLQLYAE